MTLGRIPGSSEHQYPPWKRRALMSDPREYRAASPRAGPVLSCLHAPPSTPSSGRKALISAIRPTSETPGDASCFPVTARLPRPPHPSPLCPGPFTPVSSLVISAADVLETPPSLQVAPKPSSPLSQFLLLLDQGNHGNGPLVLPRPIQTSSVCSHSDPSSGEERSGQRP